MITISIDIQQLPEKGEAYLITTTGEVIFHFIDGNTLKDLVVNNSEDVTIL